MCTPNHTSYLKVRVQLGVWGQGPQAWQRNSFMVEAAWSSRIHMNNDGPWGPSVWMMDLPLGFRVSGPFQRKGPIKIRGSWRLPLKRARARHEASRLYEGGLLRSPPEWRAYTRRCARMLRICTWRGGLNQPWRILHKGLTEAVFPHADSHFLAIFSTSKGIPYESQNNAHKSQFVYWFLIDWAKLSMGLQIHFFKG